MNISGNGKKQTHSSEEARTVKSDLKLDIFGSTSLNDLSKPSPIVSTTIIKPVGIDEVCGLDQIGAD